MRRLLPTKGRGKRRRIRGEKKGRETIRKIEIKGRMLEAPL
jgi:hypothetical protein